MAQAQYTTGGTVQAGNGIYLARRADAELLQACRDGIFAFVLAPRQIGKSSLMTRTAEQLQADGIQAVVVDLQAIGVQVNAEQWYLGLLVTIEDQLMLDTDVISWWQEKAQLGYTQRFTQFIEEVLLAEILGQIVILVDEIDTVLSLDFTDDFFVAIRYFQVNRAKNSNLERLSFVLLGVGTPSDLIRDPQRTPFNVGQRIDLTDFTPSEAQSLAAGLGLPATEAKQVLVWVLDWTGGHPYLTQRLCEALTTKQQPHWTKRDIDHLVTDTFFGSQSRQDNNLQFVRDMLTRRAPDVEAALTTYRQVWRGKPIEDEEQSLTKSHLKLSGIVKCDDTRLMVRNPIYRQVFNQSWIQEHLPESWWDRLKPAMPLLATMFVAMLGMAAVTTYAVAQQREATRQERLAQDNAEKFQAKSLEFEVQSVEAQKLQREAEQQRDKATRQEKEATRQRQRAQRGEKQSKTALNQAQAARAAENQQRRLAEERQLVADLARQGERQQRQIAEQRQKDAEVGLTRITQLLDDISGILQGDQIRGVVGFNPVQQKLFDVLLPYHAYIIATDGGQSATSWRSAEAHFRVGRASETLGDSVRAEQEMRLAFNGAKVAAETLARSTDLPPKLLQLLNETALFYAWNRMNYGYLEEAESILNVAKSFTASYRGEQSPAFIMSSARLENAFARLSAEQSNPKKALEHQLASVDLARKAVSLEQGNIEFKGTLAVYVGNLAITPESLLPKEKATAYKQEGCAIAREADKLPGAGASLLNVIVSCIYDETLQGKPDEITERLLEARNSLDTVIRFDATNIDFKLSRAWITMRLRNVEKFQRNDKEAADQYFHLALTDWLEVVGNGTTLPIEVWKLRRVFTELKDHLTAYEDTQEKEQLFRKIVSAIDKTSSKFDDSPEIALIGADSALQLAMLQKKSNPQASLANLNKAIQRFSKTNILKDTSDYSEQYTWVCNAYEERLSLQYDRKNLDAVLADFQKINEICLPIAAKYSFDIYLLQEIWSAYNKTGELLFNNQRFSEAKSILEYASYWGVKTSTELLARMYREGLGVPIDPAKAKALASLAEKQSMKRFTIPADFGGTKAPFQVYVYQKPSDYPYKGIDDQAEWLKQARGGAIPEDVLESFRKLQKIAEDNNVSFPELAAYALGKAQEEQSKPEGAKPEK